MVARISCPDSTRLQRLLDGSLPEEQQAELTSHLDSCEGCQQSLDELAAGSRSLTHVIRHVDRERPAADSAYWRALRALERDVQYVGDTHAETGLTEEVTLDFLERSEDPTHLGRLAHFEVVEVIGHGGMGVVLKALDACLQRYVAIKVLDPKFASDPHARKRFCREARAAAAISHDHVVGIHTVDETEPGGLPYLVMHYVAGESLQQRLDRGGPLELKEAVRIGMQIASGLAAAHAQGLIHRDIKPANILLEDGPGRVKITDFGLARAFADVRITQTGLVTGTPMFMAPEQARGEETDHRTDLFSLGSVLYALCTGKAPFPGSTPYLVLRQVTEEMPKPIKEINPDVPDWLVEIIDRLLAKNPDERFQSAADVARLLEAHLSHLSQSTPMPIPYIPGPRTTQNEALCARRFRRLVAAGVLAVLLFGGFIASEATGLTHLLTPLLNREPRDQARRVIPNSGPVLSVSYSPDGKTLAMAIDDGSIKLWDLAEDKVVGTLHGHTSNIWGVAFSPDGRKLVSGSDDMTVKLWDVAGRKELHTLPHQNSIRSVAFSHDGKTVAAGSRNGTVRLWDVDKAIQRSNIKAHAGDVRSVAFAPGDKVLATGSGDRTAKLWDLNTGQEMYTIPGQANGVWSVAVSPDGKTVASGGWDKILHLCDVASGTEAAALPGHGQDIWSVAFSPDSKMLATGSEDHTVKLWDLATRRERATLHGHTGSVFNVTFSPDGKTVASGSRDGTVRLWDVP